MTNLIVMTGEELIHQIEIVHLQDLLNAVKVPYPVKRGHGHHNRMPI